MACKDNFEFLGVGNNGEPTTKTREVTYGTNKLPSFNYRYNGSFFFKSCNSTLFSVTYDKSTFYPELAGKPRITFEHVNALESWVKSPENISSDEVNTLLELFPIMKPENDSLIKWVELVSNKNSYPIDVYNSIFNKEGSLNKIVNPCLCRISPLNITSIADKLSNDPESFYSSLSEKRVVVAPGYYPSLSVLYKILILILSEGIILENNFGRHNIFGVFDFIVDENIKNKEYIDVVGSNIRVLGEEQVFKLEFYRLSNNEFVVSYDRKIYENISDRLIDGRSMVVSSLVSFIYCSRLEISKGKETISVSKKLIETMNSSDGEFKGKFNRLLKVCGTQEFKDVNKEKEYGFTFDALRNEARKRLNPVNKLVQGKRRSTRSALRDGFLKA